MFSSSPSNAPLLPCASSCTDVGFMQVLELLIVFLSHLYFEVHVATFHLLLLKCCIWDFGFAILVTV